MSTLEEMYMDAQRDLIYEDWFRREYGCASWEYEPEETWDEQISREIDEEECGEFAHRCIDHTCESDALEDKGVVTTRCGYKARWYECRACTQECYVYVTGPFKGLVVPACDEPVGEENN